MENHGSCEGNSGWLHNVSDTGRKLTQVAKELVSLFHRIYSCIKMSGMTKNKMITVSWWSRSYAWSTWLNWKKKSYWLYANFLGGCHEFKLQHVQSRWFKLFLLCRTSYTSVVQFPKGWSSNWCSNHPGLGRLHIFEAFDISQWLVWF